MSSNKPEKLVGRLFLLLVVVVVVVVRLNLKNRVRILLCPPIVCTSAGQFKIDLHQSCLFSFNNLLALFVFQTQSTASLKFLLGETLM